MDREELKGDLYEALRDTLETMAFAEVLPANNDSLMQLADDSQVIWSKVGIHSARLSGIELVVPAELAAELADTMYAGLAPEDAGTVQDTLAELANTLAGKFMLGLGSDVGDFFLDVPVSGEGVPNVSGDTVVCQSVVDEVHPVRIVLSMAN